ncbi:MAG: type II toxin-antitoxin system prevent-host-death family antitoxin [Pseudomonadota bacterium]|nr:type II toxin-antitoxin system prevent-host-death family antitoxin [Pseudomonadota bacterium]
MERLDVYTARDLRNRSGEILREAEAGHLSLITKHGRPAILAIPFNERLLDHGVHRAMALHLFEARQLTLDQAAKVAGMPQEEFIELLGKAGIAAVDYPVEELEKDLEVAL